MEKEVPIFTCWVWGENKLRISIDSSTYRLSQILKTRGEELDYIQPSIPHSETGQQRKEKKKGACGHSKEGDKEGDYIDVSQNGGQG